LTMDIQIVALATHVKMCTSYHHGEKCMSSAIVLMARDYVGSNNLHLLGGEGQYGTRLAGGADAPNPRYSSVQLESLARMIFRPEDNILFTNLLEDGKIIEPTSLLPILPQILLNGACGITTAWSTNIPTFNALDIIANLKLFLDGKEMRKLLPYFTGFVGQVEEIANDEGNFITRGVWEEVDNHTVRITELPVGTWTQNYKEYLGTLKDGFFVEGKNISLLRFVLLCND
jgi:DNA topoisomerase-2